MEKRGAPPVYRPQVNINTGQPKIGPQPRHDRVAQPKVGTAVAAPAHLLNQGLRKPAPGTFAPHPGTAFLKATGKSFTPSAVPPRVLPGMSSAVQARLKREGNFAKEKTKYRTAYLVFYEAATKNIPPIFPTFRELEFDPKTTLVFTTDENMARNAETHLLIREGSEWRDTNDVIPSQWMKQGMSQSEMRIEMVLNPKFTDISQILQTLSHEWAVHGESEWQFIRWMRQQPSATSHNVDQILDEFNRRNQPDYSGEFHLDSDVQHGELAAEMNPRLTAFSKEIARFLPERKRERFMKIWAKDVYDHASYKKFARVPKPVVSSNPVSSGPDDLAFFVPESNKQELDSFYDDE